MHHKIFEYTSQDILYFKRFKIHITLFERTTQDFGKKGITRHIQVGFIVKKI